MAGRGGIGAAGAIGPALTAPQAPAPGVPSPQAQPGLWRKFQQKLVTDPNFRMALLTTGLNLLKTPPFGQSGFDQFANASLAGVGTLDQLRQRDLENERLGRTENLAERRTVATEANAATSAQNAETNAARLEATSANFASNLKLAQDRLTEFTRSNKAKEANTASTGGSTGTERLLQGRMIALSTLHPDIYPNTAEGQAKVRLAAETFKPNDPLSQGRLLGQLIEDITSANQQDVTFNDAQALSPDEIQTQAIETFRLITSDLSETATAPAEPEVDPLEGPVTQGTQTAVVHKVSDDPPMYQLELGGALRAPKYTAEQIQALRSGN